MIGWIILGLWVVCYPFAWRYLFRVIFNELAGDSWSRSHFDGGEFAMCLLTATFFAAIASCFVVMYMGARRSMRRRDVSYVDIADRLAGKPKPTKDQRIAQLEQRNQQLEKALELGD